MLFIHVCMEHVWHTDEAGRMFVNTKQRSGAWRADSATKGVGGRAENAVSGRDESGTNTQRWGRPAAPCKHQELTVLLSERSRWLGSEITGRPAGQPASQRASQPQATGLYNKAWATIVEEESSNYGWEWWGCVKKKRLLHLHLAVGLRAVLVLHMPETNGNKAFTRFTADTTLACTSIRTYMGRSWGVVGGSIVWRRSGALSFENADMQSAYQKTPHFG